MMARIDIRKGYAAARRAAYPPIEEQLDLLYHDPDAWRAKIKAVKDAHPKPVAE